jgi:hypothetical protein
LCHGPRRLANGRKFGGTPFVNAPVTFYYHYGALHRYIAAKMSIAIADALLIEAAIFLSIGVIVGFVLCAKFVQKDPWTSGM